MIQLDKLQEYYDRIAKLNKEAYDLDNRNAKLKNFIGTIDYKKLDDITKDLMIKQCKEMSDYSDILHKRIEHLHEVINKYVGYESVGCLFKGEEYKIKV